MAMPVRLGKYAITEILGQGAMGVVYKGFDPGIQRTVAIKTIRRELIGTDRSATALLARFRNEARAAGQLSHPGIVAVYDYGEDAEVAYIAMEYVEGNSLREYFDRGTHFTERDIVSIMTQLLDALAHAHSRRVWHRDIKPANLIVMMDGRVKVADFGIARIEASDLTVAGAIMGSPGYMAPEQYQAATIDHRVDIFASGVVLYQLLTGRKPFGGSAEQVAYAICHSQAPGPSLIDPDKGWERYDPIIEKALAKRPDDRFETAEAFRLAIVEAHAQPVQPTIAAATIISTVLRPATAVDLSHSPAAPPSVGATASGRISAVGKRPRTAAAALGTAAVLAVAGTSWYLFGSKPAAPSPSTKTESAAPAGTPAPPPATVRAQPDDEVVFWESVRGSTNAAELNAYLAKYPNGAFAELARDRLDMLAKAEAQRAAEHQAKLASAGPAPAPSPRQAPTQTAKDGSASGKQEEELLFWESVQASKNPAELRAYLSRYPQGTFAALARARLQALSSTEEAPRSAKSAPGVMPSTTPAPSPPSPPKEAPTIATSGPNRFDGRWTAEMACEQFMEMPPFTRTWATEIRDGVVELTKGTPGSPGYWHITGRIGDSDKLTLTGTVISAAEAYRGKEGPARFYAQFGPQGFDGSGALGRRNCTLKMTRAGP